MRIYTPEALVKFVGIADKRLVLPKYIGIQRNMDTTEFVYIVPSHRLPNLKFDILSLTIN